jgi:NAD+ synthase (glutamine-hydrolysing)
VVGTGDLSEIALGWNTYNADHMSMYNVNSSVPKTLVKTLIQWYADTHFDLSVREVLYDIIDTPISPELLPAKENGEIAQETEEIIGPYLLHDFFLYYFIRHNFSPRKIYLLAEIAFDGYYSDEKIKETLKIFYKRFFQNQFKRSVFTDGVKIGTVSLSPRGDWRMPSDADARSFLNEIESIQTE